MSALLHADLMVRDLERSLAFYVGLLACTVVDEAELEGAVPVLYSAGAARRMRLVMLRASSGPWGAMLELMQLDPPCAPAAGGAHVSFLVDDLEASCARLVAAGVPLACPVVTVDLSRLGTSRIAFVRDPDGHLVELVGPVSI